METDAVLKLIGFLSGSGSVTLLIYLVYIHLTMMREREETRCNTEKITYNKRNINKHSVTIQKLTTNQENTEKKLDEIKVNIDRLIEYNLNRKEK